MSCCKAIAEFFSKAVNWGKNLGMFSLLILIVIAAGFDAYYGKSLIWKFLVAIVASGGVLAIFFFTYSTWKKGVKEGKSGPWHVFEKICDLTAGFVNRVTDVNLRESPVQDKSDVSSKFSEK